MTKHMCCLLGRHFQQRGRVSCCTAWHKRCQQPQHGLQTMLDLLPEGIFHHLPQILSDKIRGARSAVEHCRGKGWMRFQRRRGNGVPPLSMACCTADVTEANQTTRTRWGFCLPTRSERSHIQLSGPTTAWGCPCHPRSPHLHSRGKKPAYYGDMKGFEMMRCKALGKCKWQPGQ